MTHNIFSLKLTNFPQTSHKQAHVLEAMAMRVLGKII